MGKLAGIRKSRSVCSMTMQVSKNFSKVRMQVFNFFVFSTKTLFKVP